MRTLFFVLAFYVAALAVIDRIAYNSRYGNAILSAASQQVYRTQVDLRNFLARAGITSDAVARP
jgi:hypothetical protein